MKSWIYLQCLVFVRKDSDKLIIRGLEINVKYFIIFFSQICKNFEENKTNKNKLLTYLSLLNFN